MGLRFRRTVRILPWVRLNFGLKGMSVSFGRPGAWFTIGRTGTRMTAGLPGTGLSYTKHRGWGRKKAVEQKVPDPVAAEGERLRANFAAALDDMAGRLEQAGKLLWEIDPAYFQDHLGRLALLKDRVAAARQSLDGGADPDLGSDIQRWFAAIPTDHSEMTAVAR